MFDYSHASLLVLQNDLMELWSLMHFLMPHIFHSHAQFQDWFSNPLTGMVEGAAAVNAALVSRLHAVLRPFMLRRLKLVLPPFGARAPHHDSMCHWYSVRTLMFTAVLSVCVVASAGASTALDLHYKFYHYSHHQHQ